VTALLDGSIQIGLGGIMRSLELADRDGGLLPHFAEVNSRNGFFLLAREPRPNFAWSDLEGREVISFAEAPTPWQCMLAVLRREGVDPAWVAIRAIFPLGPGGAAFRAGGGLSKGSPSSSNLAEGRRTRGVHGEATGPVPFSST
jgi:NitT/TauT family transport system substrate-binding protein